MSRQIITKVGGEPKNGQGKATPGERREYGTPFDNIGKAITNLKPKLTVSAEKRTDEAFRKLQGGIGKGSSKDVSDALTSLEAISNSHHDRNLIGLLKALKERTQKGQSTEAGISGGRVTALKSQTAAKNSIVAVEKIENGDRKKDETLTSRLALQEKKIQDIWAQFVQTQTTRSQDHLAMLNDIEKHIKENTRSVETVNEDRDNQEKMSSKLVNQERKIQDIWAQLEQTPTTRSQDHLAMLNEIDKHLKENKRQVKTLQANEKLLHEHIEELQKELETSDSESNLKGIKETGTESEIVKKVILIRKQVRCKMKNRVKVAGTDNQIIQKQVIDAWNLLFGIENNDTKADKDVNILLEFIHEELKKLEKTVFRVEESCLNIYQSLLGSDMPVQRKNTSKSERLERTLTVLTMCKEEVESIGKHLIQFYSAFDVDVKGSISRQSEQIKVTLERRFVERAPVLKNVLKMFNRTMHQQYILSSEPNVESGRSERKDADYVIAVVVDICDQVAIKYESLENALAKREQEKEELLTRLSKMAGADLTNNNPNIADLSDPNRPTKLSEMFSELYDNAWTDAFEALDKSGKGDKEKEKLHIQFLLKILSESYKTCEDVSMRQQQAIMAALTLPTGQERVPKDKSSKKDQPSALQSKAVTELRKLSADTIVPSVKLFFEENCMKEKGSKSRRSIWFDKGPLRTYTMKCIELCWFMHIQAPPVHIDLTGQPGDKFDTNKFKQYTKSGNKIDFVVWPPLLLHEQGPLLSKGVAQGI